MRIINLTDKKQLNDFVGSQDKGQFLESWEWGEFQAKVAGKIVRLGVEEEGKLIAAATLIKRALPMGKSYFLCPRGPVMESGNKNKAEIINFLFDEIKKYAEQEGAMFMRFEPAEDYRSLNLNFQVSITLDVQPSRTLILNLNKFEGELLEEMHQKTRYNIKLAEKKGVKITEAGAGRFDDFWRLMAETGERDNFRSHGIDYYRKMLETDGGLIKLYFAEYGGAPLAAGIFSFFGDTAAYLHGASSGRDRGVMAPYLLHWQLIKQAKASGYKYYDLFGIDEDRWPGVTRFKKGFGGSELQFPGTFDLVFDSGWYNIYQMVRKVRRTF